MVDFPDSVPTPERRILLQTADELESALDLHTEVRVGGPPAAKDEMKSNKILSGIWKKTMLDHSGA